MRVGLKPARLDLLRIGLNSIRALLQLRRDYAWAVDLELCAFWQEGLIDDPGCEDVFGDCSLPRVANLFANVAQIGDPDGIAACFGMTTDQPARSNSLFQPAALSVQVIPLERMLL